MLELLPDNGHALTVTTLLHHYTLLHGWLLWLTTILAFAKCPPLQQSISTQLRATLRAVPTYICVETQIAGKAMRSCIVTEAGWCITCSCSAVTIVKNCITHVQRKKTVTNTQKTNTAP